MLALTYDNREYFCSFYQHTVNTLNTELSCWNFNLVNADQFSHEYPMFPLRYWSQFCVLFHQCVAAIAHTQVDQDAPPTSEVKPIKCSDLDKFSSKCSALGLAMVEAGTCT